MPAALRAACRLCWQSGLGAVDTNPGVFVSRFQELGLWRLFRSFRVLLAGYCLGFGTTKAERGARLFGVRYFGRHWLRGQDLNLRPSGYEPMEGQNLIISETSPLRGKPLFWRDFDPRKHPRQHGFTRKTGTKPVVAG